MKNPYSAAFKLKLVREVIQGGRPTAQIARQYGVDPTGLFVWRKRYEYHGAQAFSDESRPRRRYSLAFKLKVLRAIETHALTANEAVARFQLSNDRVVRRWQRQYAVHGKQGLIAAQQPRTAAMAKSAQPRQRTEQASSSKDELIQQQQQELAYLRAENAYLKKLRALMRKPAPHTDTKR